MWENLPLEIKLEILKAADDDDLYNFMISASDLWRTFRHDPILQKRMRKGILTISSTPLEDFEKISDGICVLRALKYAVIINEHFIILEKSNNVIITATDYFSYGPSMSNYNEWYDKLTKIKSNVIIHDVLAQGCQNAFDHKYGKETEYRFNFLKHKFERIWAKGLFGSNFNFYSIFLRGDIKKLESCIYSGVISGRNLGRIMK